MTEKPGRKEERKDLCPGHNGQRHNIALCACIYLSLAHKKGCFNKIKQHQNPKIPGRRWLSRAQLVSFAFCVARFFLHSAADDNRFNISTQGARWVVTMSSPANNKAEK